MRKLGFGCQINHMYMDALFYVDDITISCPRIDGLNCIYNICNQCACNNCITFNSKKTVCIKFGEYVGIYTRELFLILN